MSILKVALIAGLLIVGAYAGKEDQESCPSGCNDQPPPQGLLLKRQFGCKAQKKFGKCGEEWMKGYCQCTCQTCPLLSVADTEEILFEEVDPEQNGHIPSTVDRIPSVGMPMAEST
eukprot:TRINITY_DN7048_c0_g1_i2.p3 TRINITY_DN7048_c0_g1~~TRINITY_DN7048_c0_g1_i2.p3  ORF type:complete len:116 (-),score=10.38 TRINITY_DN7048_c0_g1_i2:263-610(-)